MYACPNCNGGLKYDITSQMLGCEYCNAQYDPYEMDGPQTAVENDSLEVTIFTCSQCGGELYTTDTTVAGFCSFCGSTTVLNSRIEKTLRPDYIIPFQKTKEDCKNAYAKMMRFAIFAPKELKNKDCIDSFRGIYMPYWLYDVKYADRVTVQGVQDRMVDEYRVESFYRLEGDLNANYKGISFDGSSSFSDNISEKIAPFDVKNMKEFTPAYLSGFYGDTADVASEVYEKDAVKTAKAMAADYIKKHDKFKDYEIKNAEELDRELGKSTQDIHRAMLPVWFMSYRNNDRVAYATVNGQTGKVVVDLPVDIKKYLVGTLLLAIPIFILMNMFFTVIPSLLLVLVSLFSAGIAALHAMEMKEIWERDNYQDDRGMLHNLDEEEKKEELDAEQKQEELGDGQAMQKPKKNKKNKKKIPIGIWIVIGLLIYFIVLPAIIIVVTTLQVEWILCIPVVGTLVIAIIALVKSISFMKKTELKDKVPANLYCLVATVVAFGIVLLKPIYDWVYYTGTIVAMIAVLLTLIDLIQKYNVLSTRKLPQFDYKGGDDNA